MVELGVVEGVKDVGSKKRGRIVDSEREDVEGVGKKAFLGDDVVGLRVVEVAVEQPHRAQ